MLVNIKIPDETYEAYARRNPENPRLELERTLQSFQDIDPIKVSLFLNQAELVEVGKVLGLPVQDTRTLIELLKRSSLASFGQGLEVPINAGQRLRLRQMSDFLLRPGADPEAAFKEYAKAEILKGVTVVVGP